MISSTIGQRIKDLREERGITQDQLGKALYVSRETVIKWEAGQRDIKTEYTVKLAKYFNVSSDYLIGLIDVRTTNADMKAVCEYIGLSEEAVNYVKEFTNAGIREWNILNFLLTNRKFFSVLFLMENIGNISRNHKLDESCMDDGAVLFLSALPESDKDEKGNPILGLSTGTLNQIISSFKSKMWKMPPLFTSEAKDEIKDTLIKSFGEDAAIVSASTVMDVSAYSVQKWITLLIDDIKEANEPQGNS